MLMSFQVQKEDDAIKGKCRYIRDADVGGSNICTLTA